MKPRVKRRSMRAKARPLQQMSKEELFARMNASAQKVLDNLMKAYEAGSKEGFEANDEDEVIELLKEAKALREKVKNITGT